MIITTESGSQLTINDVTNNTTTNPSFVIAGYNGLLGAANETGSADNNVLSLKKGSVNGSVYAGLIHDTEFNAGADCSNVVGYCNASFRIDENDNHLKSEFNTINVSEDDVIKIAGNVYSGYAAINIDLGNINAGNAESSNGYARSLAVANPVSYDNTYDANNNKLNLSGDIQSDNLFAGYAGVNVRVGNLTSLSAISTNLDPSSDETDSRADAYASTWNYAEKSKFTANENEVNITGDQHSFDTIHSGYAFVNMEVGDLQGGNASTLNSNGMAAGKATAGTSVHSNHFTVQNNQVTIGGNQNSFNNINAGYAGVYSKIGNLTAGTATGPMTTIDASASVSLAANNSVFNVDENKISISGEGHHFKDIRAGIVETNLQAGNLKGGTEFLTVGGGIS